MPCWRRRTAGSAASIWWRCAAAGRGGRGNRRRRRRGRPWCRRRARFPARRPRRRHGRSRAGRRIRRARRPSATVFARRRSSPVTPKSTVPRPSSRAISEAERKATSTPATAFDAAAIAARRRRHARSSGRRARRAPGLVLQPALGGQREGERHARALASELAMRSSQSEKPTAGIGFAGAEQGQQPVVAAAAGQRPRRRRQRRSRRRGRCSSRAGGRRRRVADVGDSRRRHWRSRSARRIEALRAPAPSVEAGARRAKCASAAGASASGTLSERNFFEHVERRLGEADRRSTRFSLSRRAISSGERPAVVEAGRLHGCVDMGDQRSARPPATSAADRVVEVGATGRMARSASAAARAGRVRRRHGPAASASRAAGRARQAPPRTPPGRRASRASARPGSECQERMRIGDRAGVGGGDDRYRRDPRCRPEELVAALAALAEDLAEIGIALRRAGARLDVARQTGMVNSGRRQRLSPVSLSVRKMRRRRSSPAMSRKVRPAGSPACRPASALARGKERSRSPAARRSRRRPVEVMAGRALDAQLSHALPLLRPAACEDLACTLATSSALRAPSPAPTRASRQAALSSISPDRRLPSIEVLDLHRALRRARRRPG